MTIAVILMLVAAGLAALLHVFIFYMESIAWDTKGRKVFGITAEQAASNKEMAFNMGFYNLFLAIITAAGIIFTLCNGVTESLNTTGASLILAGTGSMLAAAALLFFTSPDKRAAAIKQGLFPLFAVVFGLLTIL